MMSGSDSVSSYLDFFYESFFFLIIIIVIIVEMRLNQLVHVDTLSFGVTGGRTAAFY